MEAIVNILTQNVQQAEESAQAARDVLEAAAASKAKAEQALHDAKLQLSAVLAVTSGRKIIANDKSTIEQRMATLMVSLDEDTATRMTADQYATELGCSKSTVVRTRIWQNLILPRREKFQSELAELLD